MNTYTITNQENKKKKYGSEVKKCFNEYKLQDKVDALKNYYGIRDNCIELEKDRTKKCERKKIHATGIKDCLRPPVLSTFQTIVNDLKDTVKSSYWDKEVGKTVYLPTRLPAGFDPLEKNFGISTTKDECSVADLLNPKNVGDEDSNVHKLYRKTHNDYYPMEQVDRNYLPPFDKNSWFGVEKKRVDSSGKKVANCLRWCNTDTFTLVDEKLADFLNRTECRIGKVKNRDNSLVDRTFGKKVNDTVESVADILKETSDFSEEMYCSDYGERISKKCGRIEVKNNRAAGLPTERTDLPHVVVPEGAARAAMENLGDQTSAMALVSPNIFTQLGLSHIEFFQVREYEEMRSIFENVGVEFPGDSFDDLWKEGLKKDCTGGVCVETFRNLLARRAMNVYNNEA